MTYFECHVTLLGDPAVIRQEVERWKWKFSCIDGDATLGDGVKCYATMHYNARLDTALVRGNLFTIAQALEEAGLTVLRRKVELVIFDDRSTKTQCTGACPECHLDDYCK